MQKSQNKTDLTRQWSLNEHRTYHLYIYIYICLGNFGEKNLFLTRDDDTDEY